MAPDLRQEVLVARYGNKRRLMAAGEGLLGVTQWLSHEHRTLKKGETDSVNRPGSLFVI
jgi:hypothetical protein